MPTFQTIAILYYFWWFLSAFYICIKGSTTHAFFIIFLVFIFMCRAVIVFNIELNAPLAISILFKLSSSHFTFDVILRAPRFSPSLPLLKQLHWLPVNYRIKFKLSTLTYHALAIHQPPYLASLLHFSNVPRQLGSSTSQQLSIPRTKLNLGKRAFSVAAPIIWNELPTTLKSCESLASFRKNLKTYLFKIAFPP